MKSIQRTVLLFIFSCFTTYLASAQAGYQDIVYLKNGSIIHGIIIEQVPNESIKIQNKYKDVFVFKMEEIEKIAKAPKTERKGKNRPSVADTSTAPYTGYNLTIETNIGLGVGAHNKNQTAFAARIINGVMIKNIFSVGLGVGIDVLNGDKDYGPEYSNIFNLSKHEYYVLDFYIDMRAYPFKGKFAPMLILDYGYGKAAFSQAIHGGMFFNAGVGTRYAISKRTGFNLSLNYRKQTILYDNGQLETLDGTYIEQNGSISLSYFCVAIGFTL